MKKKPRPHRPLPPADQPVPQELADGLSEAESLSRRKRWIEARDRLYRLDRRFPRDPDVLVALANACAELQDFAGHEYAAGQLCEMDPDNADLAYGLAEAHFQLARIMLALHGFRRCLERWPDHRLAPAARETVARIESRLDDLLAQIGFDDPEGQELAVLHEEIQLYLTQNRYAELREAANDMIRRRPHFASAYNNLSLGCFAEGRVAEAIRTAQRVLAFAPDNIHALGNLIRFHCCAGSLDEARQYAAPLKASQARGADRWLKKAEAFSYLGDDEAVADIVEQARAAGDLDQPWTNPLLYHLAAVAALRLGREAEARRFWQQALERAPGLGRARENYDDLLKHPVGERHAPWPVPLEEWGSGAVLRELLAVVKPGGEELSEEQARRLRRVLRRHPHLERLVPILLDRGDPSGRALAFWLAKTARTPALLTALKDFALGRRGPDSMRMEAVQFASDAGLLPDGATPLCINGEWTTEAFRRLQLHTEPDEQHTPEVERLLVEATGALERIDGLEAERLFGQALALEPDSPELQNGLSVAFSMQDRYEEAEALTMQIYTRHPAYVFARTNMARTFLRAGDTAAARSMLEGLGASPRMHVSEYVDLCLMMTYLFVAENNPNGAELWLDLLEKVAPRHRDLPGLRLQVAQMRAE